MKVALLITKKRISPVFETTCSALIINMMNSKCTIQASYYFKNQNEVDMVNELLINNIHLLVCGAIPYYLEKSLTDQGCKVVSFIAGDINDVIQALPSGSLNEAKFKMPGCKKRRNEGSEYCKRNMN